MLPLFQAYPTLADTLKHIDLCTLPTPIQHLQHFGDEVNHPHIYIKRDDISAELFGGNKARTLEFLLAAANPDGGNVVGGLPGTSMALATNIYAHKLGIPVTTTLLKQTHTHEAQTNLRYFQYVNADLIQVTSIPEMQKTMVRLTQEAQEKYGRDAGMINPNTPLGMCGYLNAIFELKQQIDEREIPEPDYIYLSSGLLGTSAGFATGLKLTGLKTRLVVCNVPQPFANQEQQTQRVLDFGNNLVTFLRQNDDSVPDITITADDVDWHPMTQEQLQSKSSPMMAWIDRMQDLENITLEATWTARVIIALEADIQSGKLDDKIVLYWHTANSQPYPDAIHDVDYKDLPEDFWHYFETDEFVPVNAPDFS